MRLLVVCICLAGFASCICPPSVQAATAKEIIVDKAFHITLITTDVGTLAFPDATGTTGSSATPVGTYKVTDKQTNPQWHWEGKVYEPYIRDQGNGLGIRWMGISLPSYGLHGTNEPFSIGKDASHGCVRHENVDIARIFPTVPIGVSVSVIQTSIPSTTRSMVSDFLEIYDLATVMKGSGS